ncbi:MAG: HD domain-containing phosphohydrolase [bacterium]
MVRISDILKKKKVIEQLEKERSPTSFPQPEGPVIQQQSSAPPAQPPQSATPVSIPPAPAKFYSQTYDLGKGMQKEPSEGLHFAKKVSMPPVDIGISELKEIRQEEKSEDPRLDKEANELYFGLLKSVREFYRTVNVDHKYFDSKLFELIKNIVNKFADNDNFILRFTNRITTPEYLYSHVVNVCILSIRLGLAVGYNKEECVDLGLAALLHDLGLVRKTALISKIERLSESEYEEIKKHSEEGRKIIYGLSFISEELKRLIAEVVYQCHERQTGAGYPTGIKGEQIHNYAQIIGLLDTYEALSHHRAYRGRFLPHDVCRWLVEGREIGNDFNIQLTKKFIEIIGLYPIGSYVRLSSGEIAEVVAVNPQYPLRPQIDIIITLDYDRLKPKKRVNLIHNPVLQIIGPVDETKIRVKDKNFALYLLSHNWVVIP